MKGAFSVAFLALLVLGCVGQAVAFGFGTPTMDGLVEAVYGAAEAVDPSGDGNGNANMDLLELYVCNDATYWYFFFTVNANLASSNWGKYLLYIDTTNDTTGAWEDAWGRSTYAEEPHEPEFSLNSWVDNLPYDPSDTQFWAWDQGTHNWSMSGGADAVAIDNSAVSGIEWKIEKSRIGSPDTLWCEVWCTGGSDTDPAQDTVNDPSGDWDATNWSDPAYVWVSTEVAEATGSDTTPPVVITACAANDTITVQFSEPVDETSAETAGNYTLTGGVTVQTATRSDSDPSVVYLTNSPALDLGPCYTLTVRNVKDLNNNTIVEDGVGNQRCFCLMELVFMVHMNERLKTVGFNPDTVAVEGGVSPLTWDPTCDHLMYDDGVAPDAVAGDSIYTRTIEFCLECDCGSGSATVPIEYQFTHQCSNWEPMGHHFYNQPGLQCGVGRDTVDVWWNDEDPTNFSNTAIAVHFQVDMNRTDPLPAETDSVMVGGSEAPLSWSVPSDIFLADDGVAPDETADDLIYSAELVFPAGTRKNVQYKYQYNQAPDYWEYIGDNRTFFLDDAVYSLANPLVLDLDLFAFKWITSRDVTVRFRVDAGSQIPAPTDTVSINGSVAPLAWDIPSISEMFDDGVPPDETSGDFIYTLDVIFPESSSVFVDYKYMFNSAYECTTGAVNRNLEIDHYNFSATTPQILDIEVFDVCFGGVEDEIGGFVPLSIPLENYPNPFNPRTTISFSIPASGAVEMAIYDVGGRKVSTLISGRMEAGEHVVTWDGTTLTGERASSGVYFCVLQTGEGRATRKVVLVK